MPPNSATALSSTTAALTLAPAHERREAREVDALLEAQRQRVIEKDEEVRRLKRHVHALSKPTPADRKQTHAYLDRHKARKGKKAGGKGSGGGKKGKGQGTQKQSGVGDEQNGKNDKAAENVDNGSSLHSTTQSTGSSVVTVDDDNDDDPHEDERQQQEEQRDRTVDLYDQMAATLDRRIQSSDSHSPTAAQSSSPFTLASSAPQSPRAESPSADVEQLAEALEQLKQLTAKQQQTITILQQQHHTPKQPPPIPQQPTRRPPPAADSLWSKEVELLLLDKYSREAASSAEAGGRGERMREVRRVLRETIGNLEEKLDEVEKWKRAALQAECERMQAIEEMKRVRTNLRQQQQQVEQANARQAVVEEEEEDEEQLDEEEEEDEDEDDDDEPMLPPSPPKRSSSVRPSAKSPTKARESRPPAAAAAVEEKEAATNELAATIANPSSVYASTATTTRSSAAPLPSITTRSSSSATTSSASITTAVTGQSPAASLAQSPTASGIVASTAAFALASQSTITTSTVTSHPTSHPSPLSPPPFSTSASALLPAAPFSLVQHTPTAVTVEVSQGALNPHFFLFSPSAPPPHTFLSCHLPPSPPSFSGLFGGHSPTYRLLCQLPLPADVKQRLVVALYAQVRGTAGGGGESAKVGEAELDVWQASAAGGGTGTLQLWWEGDDKESMTPQERLIATLPYTVRPSTMLAVEESKQQLSYMDSYSTRASASPPASSSLRGSRRASLTNAPVLPKFTMTLSIASCSVVRVSRLQLRSQCSLSDFNAPLTSLAPSSSSATSGCLHRLSVALHYPIAQCIDQLLRLHMSIDSVTAPPVGYFDIPLRPLLSDTSGGANGARCEGVRQQQWSAVHEPGTDVHVGSIEYGLQWSVTPGTV